MSIPRTSMHFNVFFACREVVPSSEAPPETAAGTAWHRKTEQKILKKAKAAAEEAEDKEALEFFKYCRGSDWESTGFTALHMAVANGTAAAARQLLQSGARLEAAADSWEGGTPLHVASEQGQAELVTMLLEWKANAFARDKKNRTPLDLAMEESHTHLFACLVHTGAGGLKHLIRFVEMEGQDAVDALDAWKSEAKVLELGGVELGGLKNIEENIEERMKRMLVMPHELKQAHLHEHVRVVMAPADYFHNEPWLVAPQKWVDLQEQNLISSPLVQVNCWLLPGIYANEACNRKLLQALKDTVNDDVFETDAVAAVVSAAWQPMRLSTILEILSCFLTVGLLCYASFILRHGATPPTESHYLVSKFSL